MFSTGFIIFLCVIAGICALIAFKFLRSLTWIFGWLRGTTGILLLGAGILLVLAALDLRSYEEILEERSLATVQLKKIDEQHYEVTFNYVYEDRKDVLELRGDQWQVDARVIRWGAALGAMGAKPAYRVDRISGRYYSLEEERRQPRTVHSLSESKYGFDSWAWIQRYSDFIPGIEASYGSATYLPMADEAIYEVALSYNGLVSKPLNKAAEEAVKAWK